MNVPVFKCFHNVFHRVIISIDACKTIKLAIFFEIADFFLLVNHKLISYAMVSFFTLQTNDFIWFLIDSNFQQNKKKMKYMYIIMQTNVLW